MGVIINRIRLVGLLNYLKFVFCLNNKITNCFTINNKK